MEKTLQDQLEGLYADDLELDLSGQDLSYFSLQQGEY